MLASELRLRVEASALSLLRQEESELRGGCSEASMQEDSKHVRPLEDLATAWQHWKPGMKQSMQEDSEHLRPREDLAPMQEDSELRPCLPRRRAEEGFTAFMEGAAGRAPSV